MSRVRIAHRNEADQRYACRLADEPSWLVPAHLAQRRPLGPRVLNDQISWQAPAGVPPQVDIDSWTVWVTNPDSGVCAPYLLDEASMQVLRAPSTSRPSPELQRALELADILVPPAFAEARRAHWDRMYEVARSSFDNGWAVLRGLIPPLHLGCLRRWYRRMIRLGQIVLGDGQSSRRYARHNEVVARYFHEQLASAVSRATGRHVRPSYVYFASYQAGAHLPVHVDRAQCEYTLSLLVDFTPEPELEAPWPLNLKTRTADVEVYQAIGDALLYRGRDIPHWRGELASECTSTSLFLHYVDVDFDGPLD